LATSAQYNRPQAGPPSALFAEVHRVAH